jgi:hypothetical protein
MLADKISVREWIVVNGSKAPPMLNVSRAQPLLAFSGIAMTVLLLSILTVATVTNGSQAVPVRYGGTECGVSVASPHKLKHDRVAVAGGTATSHLYTAEVRGTTFRLFCIRDASITAATDDLYATYRDGFLDDDPTQLVGERTVSLDAIEGREIHSAERDGTHSLVRVFIVPGRTFGVMVSGSKQAVSSEEAKGFLESIQFER